MMEEKELIDGIIDTIDNANQYRLRLEDLLSSLRSSQNQVHASAHATEDHLNQYFSDLKAEVILALDARCSALVKQVKEMHSSAVLPLNQCEEIIKKNVDSASDILQKGKTFLAKDPSQHSESMKEYRKMSNEIGLATLPEVPPLHEVACIHFEAPDVLRQQLLLDLQDYGRVLSRAPVQISSIAERPGSLVIKWTEIEEEDCPEMAEFCLQYCRGNDINLPDVARHEIKVKAVTSYTLKHLLPVTAYTFRIRGRPEHSQAWSSWSVPQSATSTLPHHAWDPSSKGFLLSNENKIAERLDVQDACTAHSSTNSYKCGQNIVFKVLEVGSLPPQSPDKSAPAEGIGLTISSRMDDLQTPGCVFVSAFGEVYLDGQEKLTKMPAFKRGSVITFEMESLSCNKVRLSIEVDEKIVTFDWVVERQNTNNPGVFSPMIEMADLLFHFVIKFTQNGWKIGVE